MQLFNQESPHRVSHLTVGSSRLAIDQDGWTPKGNGFQRTLACSLSTTQGGVDITARERRRCRQVISGNRGGFFAFSRKLQAIDIYTKFVYEGRGKIICAELYTDGTWVLVYPQGYTTFSGYKTSTRSRPLRDQRHGNGINVRHVYLVFRFFRCGRLHDVQDILHDAGRPRRYPARFKVTSRSCVLREASATPKASSHQRFSKRPPLRAFIVSGRRH